MNNKTHCKQTILYPENSGVVGRKLVDSHYPIHYLEMGGEVRSGFTKGTLQKATFELNNGHTIIYEAVEE